MDKREYHGGLIIDFAEYGPGREWFETLEQAQAFIRRCGPDFAGVTLRQQGSRVVNEDGGIVGAFDSD